MTRAYQTFDKFKQAVSNKLKLEISHTHLKIGKNFVDLSAFYQKYSKTSLFYSFSKGNSETPFTTGPFDDKISVNALTNANIRKATQHEASTIT
jgi:hypothetical protein